MICGNFLRLLRWDWLVWKSTYFRLCDPQIVFVLGLSCVLYDVRSFSHCAAAAAFQLQVDYRWVDLYYHHMCFITLRPIHFIIPFCFLHWMFAIIWKSSFFEFALFYSERRLYPELRWLDVVNPLFKHNDVRILDFILLSIKWTLVYVGRLLELFVNHLLKHLHNVQPSHFVYQ